MPSLTDFIMFKNYAMNFSDQLYEDINYYERIHFSSSHIITGCTLYHNSYFYEHDA